MQNEDTRKIQRTGKSSFVITLPKEWIDDLGLGRGDPVRIARKNATVLEVYPPKYETRTFKKSRGRT